MYALGLGLAIATVLAELLIVCRSDRWLSIFRRHTGVAVVFSVGLSFLFGSLFGAAGVTVLFAAIGSTVITTLLYKCGVIPLVKRIGGVVSDVRKGRR